MKCLLCKKSDKVEPKGKGHYCIRCGITLAGKKVAKTAKNGKKRAKTSKIEKAKKRRKPMCIVEQEAIARQEAESVYDGSTPLTDSQHEAFAQAIFEQGLNKNISDAYKAAGYKVNSTESASACGCRLLNNAKVSARIEWLKKQVASAKILTKIEALEILSERAKVKLSEFVTAGIDGANYIDFGPEKINDRGVKKIKSKTTYTGDDNAAALLTELEICEPEKAIALIAKILGWEAAEKHEVTHTLRQIMDEIAEEDTRVVPGEEEE